MRKSLERVLLSLCLLQVASCSYQPTYTDHSSVLYNVTGDSKRFPDQTVVAEDGFEYFISDFNFDAVDGKLLIGAADKLYLLNSDLSPNTSLDLSSTPTERSMCDLSTTTDNPAFSCHNHIRVYRRIPGQDTLLVCGTHAGVEPRCQGVAVTEGGGLSAGGSGEVASDGLISYYPEFSGFGEFRNDSDSDPVYLSAGFFQGDTGAGRHFSISYQNITLTTPSDPNTLETTELFRTINANNNWLRFPVTFVGSHRADYSPTDPAERNSDYQFWFLLLRENLVTDEVIYSRLVRICRNDPGSQLTSGGAKYFTTFMKARIFCQRDKPSGLQFTGTLDYIYNSITSFTFTESSRYYGEETYQKHLYGAFTGPLSGPVGSAVCVYSAENTAEDGGTGRTGSVFDIFRQDIASDADGTNPFENYFLECAPEGRQEQDQQLLFITKSVDQIGDDPILVLDDVVVTQMVQDSVCVVTRDDPSTCVNQDVLFLGLDSGRVLKVVFRTDENGDSDPVITENIELDDDNAVTRMTIEKGSGLLYVSSWSKVYQLPLHRCSRFDSCSECVASRDPYCVWSNGRLECVQTSLTAIGSGTGAVNDSLYFQSIHTGESTGCDYPQVGFVVMSVSVSEGMASVELGVTASGPGHVRLTLEEGTAAAGADYSAMDQVIEFVSASVVTVSVTLFGDSVVEGDEWFIGRLHGTSTSGVILTQDSVNITILDDDSIELSFSTESYSVSEGSSFIAVSVNKVGETNFFTSVAVQSLDDTAIAGVDYLQQAVVLTFEPNINSLDIVIPLVNDDVMEATEEFSLSLELVRGGQSSNLVSPSITNVVILDDDEVSVSLSASSSVVFEGQGSVEVQVALSGETHLPVTVLLSTRDGSATSASDFSDKTNEETVFSADQMTRSSTVTLVNDVIAEDDEVFHVTITAPPNAPPGLRIVEGEADITITDTDTVILRLASTAYTWSEGDGVVTVVIEKIGTNERNISACLQADPRTARGGLDYETEFSQVQFSSTDTQQEVTMVIVDDDELEDVEMFFLTLNIGQGARYDDNSYADVVILDNDEVIVQIDSEPCTLTVAESADHVEILIAKIGLSSIPVEVMVQIQNGTATEPSDYSTAMTSEVVSVSASASWVMVEVGVVNDTVVEGRENFSVSLRVEQGGVRVGGASSTTITITDDDSVSVSLSESSVTVSEEASSVSLTLSLTGSHSVPVTASLTTLPGSATAGEDFEPVTDTVTFNPGVFSASVSVAIVNDDIREAMETFQVSVTGDGVIVTAGSITQATVQILDSDTVEVNLLSDFYSVTEDGCVVTVIVEVTGSSAIEITVILETVDGTATAPDDYISLSRAVLIPPGVAQTSVDLTIEDDLLMEDPETLLVSLAVAGGQTGVRLGSNTTATVSITDDDGPRPAIISSSTTQLATSTEPPATTSPSTEPSFSTEPPATTTTPPATTTLSSEPPATTTQPATTTTQPATTTPSATPSAGPDIDTPSTGELGKQSGCLYPTQGAAIATITILAALVTVLFTTNAVTLLYLCHRGRWLGKTGSTHRDVCDLDMTNRGAVNKSFEDNATIVTNQWAADGGVTQEKTDLSAPEKADSHGRSEETVTKDAPEMSEL